MEGKGNLNLDAPVTINMIYLGYDAGMWKSIAELWLHSGTTAVTHCIFTSGLQGDIIRHSLSAPVLSTVYCKSDRNSSMSREAEE